MRLCMRSPGSSRAKTIAFLQLSEGGRGGVRLSSIDASATRPDTGRRTQGPLSRASPLSKAPAKRISVLRSPSFDPESPSRNAVLETRAALQGLSEETLSEVSLRTDRLLPLTTRAQAILTEASRELVIRCCCAPVELYLEAVYGDALQKAVSREMDKASTAKEGKRPFLQTEGDAAATEATEEGSLAPSPPIAVVVEHIVSLLPLLEDQTQTTEVQRQQLLAQRQTDRALPERGDDTQKSFFSQDGGSVWVAPLLHSLALVYGQALAGWLERRLLGEEKKPQEKKPQEKKPQDKAPTAPDSPPPRTGGDEGPSSTAVSAAFLQGLLRVLISDLVFLCRLACTLGVYAPEAGDGRAMPCVSTLAAEDSLGLRFLKGLLEGALRGEVGQQREAELLEATPRKKASAAVLQMKLIWNLLKDAIKNAERRPGPPRESQV